MSNEYIKAADKISELINEYSTHSEVTDTLRRGHAKLVNLARTKSIIKVASKSGEHAIKI